MYRIVSKQLSNRKGVGKEFKSLRRRGGGVGGKTIKTYQTSSRSSLLEGTQIVSSWGRAWKYVFESIVKLGHCVDREGGEEMC